MSENKKKKFNPFPIIFVIGGGLLGFFGMDIFDKLFGKVVTENPLIIPFIMLMFLLSFFLAPLIHESGHLVMGLLTGYEFVSFRIGSLTFVKENGKLVRKSFNIVGTGGQCILTYRITDDPQNIPYFWYHFGGVFFNFMTTLICIPVISILKNPFVKIGFIMIAVISLILGIVNIIPTDVMGAGTDGYNLILLKKSPAVRSMMYKTMIINAMQYQGVKLEDIPDNILTFTDEEKNCSLGIVASVLEANLLMNRHDFEQAEEKYSYIANNENCAALYRNESKCEMMFCMIMNGCSEEDIDKVYNDELKNYIKTTEKNYVMRKRLMYAYYLIIKKDAEKSSQEYALAQKMESTYPGRGEYLSEMELINYVKDNFS